MGLVHAQIKVMNLADRSLSADVQVLVDTGALFSMLPRTLLQSLGIQPTRQRAFRIEDGNTVTMDVGDAMFEYQGESAISPVIFGDSDLAVLGVVTMESLGLEVDPTTGQLRRMPALPLYAGA